MSRRLARALVIAAVVLLAALLIVKLGHEILNPKVLPTIAVGTGNPGLILLFRSDGKGGFSKSEIDSERAFVYTVRIGDIKNDGRRAIVAGESNSFFAEPYGCRVRAYYPMKGGGWDKETIDEVGDVRCKDLTIGDADNDGKNEIVLGTHGEGIIRLYKWEGNRWKKTDLDRNVIGQFDAANGESHLVPKEQLTYEAVMQTAVHIVKIGDVDNDGRNEVIATISSPLELDGDELSFIKVYAYSNGSWSNYTVDRRDGRKFRGIAIGDVFNTGRNSVFITTSSPSNGTGRLWEYSWTTEGFTKRRIYDDPAERGAKGLSIGDLFGDKRKCIVLATGLPSANVYVFEPDYESGQMAGPLMVDSISSSVPGYKGNDFNAFAASVLDINGDGKKNIVVAGSITEPGVNVGWEGSSKGFVRVYSRSGQGSGMIWQGTTLDTRNALGMDVGFIG